MVGRLGVDIFGDQSVARLKAEKINCDFISRDSAAASGVALISVDGEGENHIVVAPGANNTLHIDTIDTALSSLPENAIVLMQLEIPIETVAHVISFAKDSNRKVILDPAPARELPENFLDGLFLITPNETEATHLSGIEVIDQNSAKAAAKKLLQTGVKNVAITMGTDGVLLASGDDNLQLIASPTVNAVDTTAAGDCFNGALSVALANGLELEEGINKACHAASISVTRKGAQDSMPFSNEVNLCL
jgi:ribokinase